jgi:hypothetical protein
MLYVKIFSCKKPKNKAYKIVAKGETPIFKATLLKVTGRKY